MKLHEFILKSAHYALKSQRSDGSMPEGFNGPWNKIDTPVRTTAHWAMTFMHAYESSHDEIFKHALDKTCSYLLSDVARPTGDLFVCRSSENAKDASNGLIGQAWAIQPLLKMGADYGRDDCMEVALDVICRHVYDECKHGWHNIDLGGENRGYCHTINQQVWFAAMVQQATGGDHELQEKLDDFLGHLPLNVQMLEHGLVAHRQAPRDNESLFQQMKRNILWGKEKRKKERLKELSDGYLSFILYGFALMEKSLQAKSLLEKKDYVPLLRSMLNYAVLKLSANQVGENRYAWSYNPIGIELAFAVQQFPSLVSSEADSGYWIQEQFQRHASNNPPLLYRNTTDPIILAARIYEATVLKDVDLAIGRVNAP